LFQRYKRTVEATAIHPRNGTFCKVVQLLKVFTDILNEILKPVPKPVLLGSGMQSEGASQQSRFFRASAQPGGRAYAPPDRM
jgi:hypothetical protein